MNLNIRDRLIAGFAVMAVILAVAVGMTIFQVSKINTTAKRIINLRLPTAEDSSSLVNSVHASLASLRGYMLTGAKGFKDQRAEEWANIETTVASMDELSKSWTNPKNVENLQVFKGVLEEFRIAQKRVEDIAKTPQEQPATLILVTEAAPLAGVMVKNITKMIDLELQGKGGTGGDRVQILGMMADTRGTLGLGLANIRAYLLTSQDKFANNFKKLWKKNDRRFADLSGQFNNLSADQQAAFKSFETRRKKFSPLPIKMFDIRGSKKWNMANYMLLTQAAPRAAKLLDALLGEKNDEGVREGGMQRNQLRLLNVDSDANEQAITLLLVIEWALLAIGLGLAAAVAFFIIRSIIGPVNGMIGAMGSLAEGQLETEIPALDKTDEIGQMAQAVQVFKENAIRVKQMNEEAKEQERLAAEEKERLAREKEQQARQKVEDEKEQERQATEEKTRMMNQMADDFQTNVGGVIDTVSSAATELQSSAQSMMAISEETSTQASSVAAASEEASTNVQTVASAAEELSGSISEISRQVTQS
ncbi:MAG TPA: HAMP domain-containing protein, partial [Rhodospirillales bacterium]|nr:HAMP domain-containing protein [Rhodospirillales bacterium]